MNENIASPAPRPRVIRDPVRILLPSVILFLLAAILVGYGTWRALQPSLRPAATGLTPAAQFEEEHGLSVHLIGVTAGGGMIDFRLKIRDEEKARRFLEDEDNLPRLIAADSGKALAGAEGLDNDIHWEQGGILFILFSNNGGLIKQDTPVIVEFGDVRLEPILAQ